MISSDNKMSHNQQHNMLSSKLLRHISVIECSSSYTSKAVEFCNQRCNVYKKDRMQNLQKRSHIVHGNRKFKYNNNHNNLCAKQFI